MTDLDPLDLLFGGMDKLGPSDPAHTLRSLRSLPLAQIRTVVDAGCGAGRQSLLLARELGLCVHAVDSHAPFLAMLRQRAEESGLAHLINPHCMDMADIASAFSDIDLLWSEGAAYNIGLGNALSRWLPALSPAGCMVISELCWLTSDPPPSVREYFREGYPDMRTTREVVELAERRGLTLLATHTLPRSAWLDGYYDILEPRATALADHPDHAVRTASRELLREIAIFDESADSYGYVFFALARSHEKQA